jgi:hypothetical protein
MRGGSYCAALHGSDAQLIQWLNTRQRHCSRVLISSIIRTFGAVGATFVPPYCPFAYEGTFLHKFTLKFNFFDAT